MNEMRAYDREGVAEWAEVAVWAWIECLGWEWERGGVNVRAQKWL